MIVPSICLILAVLQTPSKSIRLEAEEGVLTGPAASTTGGSFSGWGYVSGFTHGNDWVTWRTEAKGGLYDVLIGYRTPSGQKGYDLRVNGRTQSGMFPASKDRFVTISAGKVELLSGVNEIAIGRGWGYYDIDFVLLSPSKPFAPPSKPPASLADPKATAATKVLMLRLVNLYGKKTLSGQYDTAECDFVRQATGQTPAILGGDLMAYSPSRLPFAETNNEPVEKIIERAKKGALVTLSWHWNAPSGLLDKMTKDAQGRELDARWYKGFYTYASTFDIEKALSNPDSDDYRLILRDIDAAAVQLRKFQAAGIPVLWRPLHEAEGKWFWWGAKGPEPLKKLWRLMYDRLTKIDGLHNLIWVFNSANPDWYPGDDVVDVMSVDQYPSDRTDPLATSWADLVKRFSGRKLLALAEFPGAPDIERMVRFGVRWSYFVSWTGDVGPKATAPEVLRSTYRSRYVANAPRSR